MSRTITALFDERNDAEAAKERLKQSNVDAGHISIHDKSSSGFSDNTRSSHSEPGLWGSVKNAFLPDEDRHTYEEGVRRGGFLLTVDVDDHNVDDAVRVLEEANTVDVDERTGLWRSEGWNQTQQLADDTGGYAQRDDRVGSLADDRDEQRIPIVEEQLVVGKREVDRGGVRVRSYVTETPVQEQIRLRNERVDVERRPVDRAVNAGDDAFRERTIDLQATGEEAVVGKTARVVEEVIVSKSAEEHVETVDDSVRRTDVAIDRDGADGRAPDRSRS